MCSHLIGKILSLRQQDKLDCSLNVLLETFPKPVKCTFRLPMDYLEETDVHTISPEVSADLELLQNNTLLNPETGSEEEGSKPLVHYLYEPRGPFSEAILPKVASVFTSNRAFLKDTQQVLSSASLSTSIEPSSSIEPEEEQQVLDVWDDLVGNPEFLEKYGYLEWDVVKHLNSSSAFLQSLSLLNGVVPLFNLFMSVILAILPFFLLSYAGEVISLNSYTECLRQIGGNNQMFCKMISMLDPANFSPQNAVVFLLMLALYAYQIYQNIIHTERFYQHLTEVSRNLFTMKRFVEKSQQRFETFLQGKPENAPTYNLFYMNVENHVHQCDRLAKILAGVQDPDQLTLFRQFTHMGEHFRLYYHLYDNEEAQQTILFCMNMNGYLDLLDSVSRHLRLGNVHLADFSTGDLEEDNDDNDDDDNNNNKEKGDDTPENKPVVKNAIQGMYYPRLVGKPDIVKNDVDFDQHTVLTGPNASGKTTFLKALAINTLLSQQVGLGFYDEYRLREPYKHIHSYLNIPDTSERDSLFEAETRRCKIILEKITHSPNTDAHLCIFDELFSGTNPVDASRSAYSFLKHLCVHYPCVDFAITTHYTDICRKIEDDHESENTPVDTEKKGPTGRRMVNRQMNVLENQQDHSLTMTYQMIPGISDIKGASNILENMGFPDDIVQEVRTGGGTHGHKAQGDASLNA